MIVKFQSVSTADVITFADVARVLLKILGKEPTARGVITPEEMPEALARLAALKQQEGKPGTALEDSGVGVEPHEWIALSRRAEPFLRMLDRAHLAGKAVTWTAAADFFEG